ncbi:hypothetical protein AWZ03_004431 [Drosophila navojoa]|uniref:Uncharacterized protein n=1 Tax=Drosophila navojoa TaxID=7232 RepID=A0A484BN26_DRONA|nr:hypothetical protein AWZ03_004431 [Drosophila navojoa]
MSRFLILFSSLAFLCGSSATALSDLLGDVQQSLNLLHLGLETPLKLFNAALGTANEKSKFAPVKRVTTEVSDSSEVITIVKAPQPALPLSHALRPYSPYLVEDSLNAKHNRRPQVYDNAALPPSYNSVRMWADNAFKGGPGKALGKPLPESLARGPARYPPNRNPSPGKATQQAPNSASSSHEGQPKGDMNPTAADLFSSLTGWLNG